MTVQTFIEKAIKGGYPNPYPWMENQIFVRHRGMGRNTEIQVLARYVLLDPEAWKAVGKVEGWGDEAFYDEKQAIMTVRRTWLKNMHRMIDHLAEGGTIESYLETL